MAYLFPRARLPNRHPGHTGTKRRKNLPMEIIVDRAFAFLKTILVRCHDVVERLTMVQPRPNQIHILLHLCNRSINSLPGFNQNTPIFLHCILRDIKILALSADLQFTAPITDKRRTIQPVAYIFHEAGTFRIAGNDPTAAAFPLTAGRRILAKSGFLTFLPEHAIIPVLPLIRVFLLTMTTDFSGDRRVTFPEVSGDFLGFEPCNEKVLDLATLLSGEMCHFFPLFKICKSKRTSPLRRGEHLLTISPFSAKWHLCNTKCTSLFLCKSKCTLPSLQE